jgi:hypothetical protein
MIGRVAAIFTAAAVAVALVAPVAAAPLERGTFHEEFTFTDEDFCEAGLVVRIDGVVDGKFKAMRRGRAGLIYFVEHVRVAQTFTNVDNTRTVTSRETTVSKDLHVTDNDDGTLTVVFLATGNFTVYGSNGKAIARNPGQIRIEVVVDHGGTPDDPSDDTLISETVIKESTGRSDDFCAAVVPALS